jgi:molybdopterin-guanine dinucleotide biosynthesis protein A
VTRVRFDGIVLAGGRARRLDGISKPAVEVGGRRLIDIAVEAVAAAASVIAVGAPLAAADRVQWTREDPAGGGPVAAIAAALDLVHSPAVVVLAADLPFVTATAVDRLLAAYDATSAGVVAVDETGRDQPLLACYRVEALRLAMPEVTADASMRSLMDRLRRNGPVSRIDLGGTPPVTWDCDTAADLTRARELV